jgi:hypothetical protein
MNNQLFPIGLLGINHEMQDKIKMRNEPNFNKRLLTNDYRLTTINMQNKDNLPNNQRRKNEKRTQFQPQGTNQTRKRCKFYPKLYIYIYFKKMQKSAHFYSEIHKKLALFLKKLQKCEVLDTNTLNSMYNKGLQEHSPQNTLHL